MDRRVLFKQGGHLAYVEAVAVARDAGQVPVDLNQDPAGHIGRGTMAQGVESHREEPFFVHRSDLCKQHGRPGPVAHEIIGIAVMGQQDLRCLTFGQGSADHGADKGGIMSDMPLGRPVQKRIFLGKHEHRKQRNVGQFTVMFVQKGEKSRAASVSQNAIRRSDQRQ
ncbi:hypothetical protein SDC9_146252 [bioreactor metagenome]|uniref:Uncharacterized protein n=1 Tax=bioreactor metagenome TaxID=1076179 RepID=A0A645EEP2_9ZZZZ